jgi:hypothetical protein
MNSKWLHAQCTKQPSPYLKRIEAHLFERKLSLTDTSFQVLMNFFIDVSTNLSQTSLRTKQANASQFYNKVKTVPIWSSEITIR